MSEDVNECAVEGCTTPGPFKFPFLTGYYVWKKSPVGMTPELPHCRVHQTDPECHKILRSIMVDILKDHHRATPARITIEWMDDWEVKKRSRR